jgi:hypothetical protein
MTSPVKLTVETTVDLEPDDIWPDCDAPTP